MVVYDATPCHLPSIMPLLIYRYIQTTRTGPIRLFPAVSFRPPLFRNVFFLFNDTSPTEIYTLSLHDALPIYRSISVLEAGSSPPFQTWTRSLPSYPSMKTCDGASPPTSPLNPSTLIDRPCGYAICADLMTSCMFHPRFPTRSSQVRLPVRLPAHITHEAATAAQDRHCDSDPSDF